MGSFSLGAHKAEQKCLIVKKKKLIPCISLKKFVSVHYFESFAANSMEKGTEKGKNIKSVKKSLFCF